MNSDRKRILRVTPFDFVRVGRWGIGAFTTSEALGYYRWLSLNLPLEHQRALNRGAGVHPYQRPCIPISRDIDEWMHSAFRSAIAPPYGDMTESWRRLVYLHVDDLLTARRLNIVHWNGPVSMAGLDRIQAQKLPFDPNPFHGNARHVTHATMEPTRVGWLVRLFYDTTSIGRSSWVLQYQIRDSKLSVGAGLEAIADHLLDPERAADNRVWFQSLDCQRPITVPVKNAA